MVTVARVGGDRVRVVRRFVAHRQRRSAWPQGSCPSRERFRRTVLTTPLLTITRAEYGSGDDLAEARGVDVLRACLRATGADPPIAQGSFDFAGTDSPTVVGTSGP